MKKHLFLVLFLLPFHSLNAQVVTHMYVSGHIHIAVADSMYHDSTRCESSSRLEWTITIDSSYVGDSVRVVDTFGDYVYGPYINTAGASPWTFTTLIGTYTNYDMLSPGAAPGSGGYMFFSYPVQKVTTALDTLRYVTISDSAWTLPCQWAAVTGLVYIDNNANCIFDMGDSVLNSMILPDALENLSSPTVPTFSLSGSGGWSGVAYTEYLQQSWMVNYTVSMPSAMAFIFPMSSCFSGPYTFTTLPQTGVDFPLQCTSNVDVQSDVLSPGRVRLHNAFYIHPYVSNTGCDTVSGTMTLIKDSRTTYDATLSTHPADTVHGDTLIWNYAPLNSLSAGAYWNSFMADIYLVQDTTVVAGDTLCFQVYANTPPTDVNPYNNYHTVCLPVVYSFDPNSKDVSPAGTGPGGELPHNTNTLTYTINFQNTGTDYAENVKVIDTLDHNLDPHSLKILGTSHNMSPEWLAANIVAFNYQNIMLPDSIDNEPQSHGQVQFSINIKPGVPIGTDIQNTAYIYFDTNPAVVTNTTSSTTSAPSAVAQIAITKAISVYPNPAIDQLNVENFRDGDLVIMDMNGSTLITQHAVNNKTAIGINSLPCGLYILKATNSTNTATIKFTKY